MLSSIFISDISLLLPNQQQQLLRSLPTRPPAALTNVYPAATTMAAYPTVGDMVTTLSLRVGAGEGVKAS